MRVFLKNVSTVWAVNLVNGVLGILFVPIAVHRLGTAGYGLFSIYTVLAGYVALTDLGIGTNLQRLLAGAGSREHGAEGVETEQWRREQLRTAWGFYLLISAGLLGLLIGLVQVVPDVLFPVGADARRVVQWITVFAVLDFVLGVPVLLMQNTSAALERFDRYSRFNLVSGLVRYALMFGAVFLTRRPEVVVAAMVARRLVDVPLAIRMTGGLPAGSWRPRFAREPFRRFLAGTSMLSVAQLLQVSIIAVPAMLVNWFFGIRALGVYRATFDLVSRIWFFSNAIGLVLFPKFVRMLAGARERLVLLGLLPRLLSLSWIAYGVLAMAGVLAGPAVLGLFGLPGGEFGALFTVLVGALSFNAHATTAYAFTLAAHRSGRAVALGVVGMTLLLVMFFVARAQGAGLLAIAWAWAVSQLVYAFAADLSGLRMLGAPIRPVRDLGIRVIIVAAVALAILAQLAVLPRAAVLAGILLAVVALALGPHELRSLRAFTAHA